MRPNRLPRIAPYGGRGLKHHSSKPRRRQSCIAPYGGRGLKLDRSVRISIPGGIAPYGGRGLKPTLCPRLLRFRAYRPLRGAWIETGWPSGRHWCCAYRPLRGAWIETLHVPPARYRLGIAPYGGRGLKRHAIRYALRSGQYRPLRGAWIETGDTLRLYIADVYRPLRGAWIETPCHSNFGSLLDVSPPTGGVD